MKFDIKDKIKELSLIPGLRYCLLKVNYNEMNIKRERHYTALGPYSNLEYNLEYKFYGNNEEVQLSKDELLGICATFTEKLLAGKDVTFKCIRNKSYEQSQVVPYKRLKDKNMDLMTFSRKMNKAGVGSDTQYFQFSLSSGQINLCGYVHGYEALSELTSVMASNLKGSKVKVKYGFYCL